MNNIKYSKIMSESCNILNYLLENIFIIFGSQEERQIIPIPISSNCAPLDSFRLNIKKMGSIIEHLYLYLLQNYDQLVDETTSVLLLA